jgi:hypothetical protein
MKKIFVRLALMVGVVMSLTFCVSVQGSHPAYLHALDDLRAARWMIEHRPADWARTVDDVEAVSHIDWAIFEIRLAAIDDGKSLDSHPAMDEQSDPTGRLHQALDFLKKARADVAQEEDNSYAKGLRDRTIKQIDAAIQATHRALND